MAAKALNHQMSRTVRVNRLELLKTLKANRERHLTAFNEAMDGYKAEALAKVEEAFTGLETRLMARKAEMVARLETFTKETADRFGDYLTILEQVTVNLKKPVSYTEAYDAAIDMATYDVRDELELSGAEFQCFVRDVWDWTYEFSATNSLYAGKAR